MAKVLLEANAMHRRYHQASVVLMARVWTSYLGFVTGMVLAIIGAVFILGRVQGTYTSMEAKVADANVALKTSTPGIVLAAMGVLLMIATLSRQYNDHGQMIDVRGKNAKRICPGPPATSILEIDGSRDADLPIRKSA